MKNLVNMFKRVQAKNSSIQEIRVNIVTGEVEKIMVWPVAENPDKTWGSRGYERETR